MNIWILNHYAVPQKYYYLARSYNFAQQLIKRGHKVTIFGVSSVHNSDINLIEGKELYREMEEDGIPYVLFRGRQYEGSGKARVVNHVEGAWRMYRHCPKFVEKYGKPDVIFASAGQSLTLVAGIFLAKKLGIPCVSEVTDLWPESFVAYGLVSPTNPVLKLLYAGERWIYKKSDAIIFSMEGGRDYIIEKGWDKDHGGPIDLNKIFHINNGVDLEKFDYNRENFSVDDADLDDSSTFKVVYTGSLREVNDISALIDSVPLIDNTSSRQLSVLVYGDGDKKEDWAEFCRENNLSQVKFKGRISKNSVPYVLSRADVCFVDGGTDEAICRYGMSQNKLFDYLAAGKPVISPVDDRYDIVSRHGCGFKLSNDAHAVAQSISSLMNSIEQCGEMSKAARLTALQYDFETLTDKLIAILNAVQE